MRPIVPRRTTARVQPSISPATQRPTCAQLGKRREQNKPGESECWLHGMDGSALDAPVISSELYVAWRIWHEIRLCLTPSP